MADVLGQTGLDLQRLELEVTESVAVEEEQANRLVLEEMRALGVRGGHRRLLHRLHLLSAAVFPLDSAEDRPGLRGRVPGKAGDGA